VSGDSAADRGPCAERRDRIAAGEPAIAGGVSAATVAATGAALVERVARGSAQGWDGAMGAIGQSRTLARRLERLATADAKAFADAQAQLRRGAEASGAEHDYRLGAALERAAEIPAAVAAASADVAELAAEAVAHAAAEHRADAAVASALAAGAASAAEHLVRVNLTTGAGSPLLVAATAATARAFAAAGRARAQST
jgi:formiminotetrahydrofolate cyclodeaminase